ncbi:WGR domain-containing protein [Mesorhizobium sp.]|uniref:WGR domain-containing protein n=1 Tax=Mesorhizobium sp. TaxID=1871066 RepID=UPI00345B7DE2
MLATAVIMTFLSDPAAPITAMNRSSRLDSKNSLDAASKPSETAAMENGEAGPVHLRRIDPSQNMRRFYMVAIQTTLFGGASVIRNWGRTGTSGQSMMETFDSEDSAATASMKLQRTKRQRGYRDCGPD